MGNLKLEEVTVMNHTFGTNSAGTKEWLAATKDMQLSAADPVFSRTEVTVVKVSQSDIESAKKTHARASSSRSQKTK